MKPYSISLSQVTDYSTCGKKWQLKKLIRAPFVEGLGMIFGKAVHAGLETFNHDHFVLASGTIDRKAVISEFQTEFKDRLTERAMKDEYDKIQRQKNARKALKQLSFPDFKAFHTDELLKIGESHLEQYMDRDDHGSRHLIIEERCEEELFGLPFTYIIDLLDVYKGKVRLRDYKTRAKADPKLARLQLTGYAWSLRKYKEIDVEIIEQINFVKTPSNPRVMVLEYDPADLAKDFDVFEQEVHTFIRGVDAGIFPRNREHYCDSCGAKEVCFDPSQEQVFLDKQEEKEEAKEDRELELVNTGMDV